MKKILAVVVLSVLAAPVLAAESGFYAGVDLGRSSTGNIAGAAAMTKSTDTVFGLLAGYQFTRNWGAEAFYSGAGKWTTTTGSGKADAFGLAAVGTLPLSDSFALYGKLGYASTKTTASSVPAALASATRGTATYGLGGVYNATPNIGVRLGWDRYGAATSNLAGVKSNYNANVYSLGAVFQF